jgi:YD repeat-containing protein
MQVIVAADVDLGHTSPVANTVTDVYSNVTTPTTTYTYSSSTGLLDTVTDPEGRETSYQYLSDGSRRLWKTTTELGTTELGYDSVSGEVSSYEDALSRTTTLTLDDMGRVLERTDPASHSEEWEYNSAGLLESYTNRNGDASAPTYDQFGRGLVQTRVEAVESDVERTTESRFNDAGWVDAVRSANGAWTEDAFDAVGRLLTSTNALGGTRRNFFNRAGELLEERDESGNAQCHQVCLQLARLGHAGYRRQGRVVDQDVR